eukprot:TRINITY_DN1617_c0_g2_i3.p1 TRINITY_DN1617_c0_g2~~TRINITY_DN1617_c0_g2_i3.p1  ORF type:complete len:200 (-),score=29.22 TRINITY_DN1617_c0_g2_i3:311-910(-)
MSRSGSQKPNVGVKASTPTPASSKNKSNQGGQGRNEKAQSKTRTTVKSIYENPFQVPWPTVSKEVGIHITNRLTESCLPITKKRKSSQITKRNKRRKINTVNSSEAVSGVEEPEEPKLSGMVTGINQVTKGLERDELSLVILSKTSESLPIVCHLPLACCLKHVPLCSLNETRETLGDIFSLPRVVSVGIKVNIYLACV